MVKNAEAAANPDLATLELPVGATSVKLTESSGGGLTATDSGSGGTVLEAPKPLMWDSSEGTGENAE